MELCSTSRRFPGTSTSPRACPETLSRLSQALDGAVALISGRTIADLDQIFAPLIFPAAGQHGGELRISADAPVKVGAPPKQLSDFEPKLAAFLRHHSGLVVEKKGLSIAIHYRAAPAEETAIHQFLEEAIDEAGGDLTLCKGKKVVEVKTGLTSKGTAVAYFMERPPFAGRTPFFIGDDRTDEDGFAAVRQMGGPRDPDRGHS